MSPTGGPGDVIEPHPEGATVRLWVQPRAAGTEIAGLHGGALKLRVAAPPAGGAANDAVCAFLAAAVGVRTASVELLAGAQSRDKLVLVRGVTPAEVLDGLLGSA